MFRLINLWSISPADLRAGRGEWRFDGTLLRSEGREHQRYRGLAETGRDGMHPRSSTPKQACSTFTSTWVSSTDPPVCFN